MITREEINNGTVSNRNWLRDLAGRNVSMNWESVYIKQFLSIAGLHNATVQEGMIYIRDKEKPITIHMMARLLLDILDKGGKY